jgi:peptidoglycan hydrolase-like protein with peptidoglycan-binding domain
MSFLLEKKFNKVIFVSCFAFSILLLISHVSAETVSGNGYILEQVISPIGGAVSGNGYVLNQSGQEVGGVISGGGYQSQGVFGTSSSPTIPAPIVTPPSVTSGGSWFITGYYVLPVTSTSTVVSTTSPKVNPDTILTTNGSTCSSRIALSSPIDVGLKNDPTDVKKLQIFLNTYENEKLPVTGIYGKEDYIAVKKWQAKYSVNILAPMRLKKPTGTVYTSSMRQIERQTTAVCGQQILVHSCPYFKTNMSYGDTGTEVKKIQLFLNIVQGERLPVNGKYGPATVAAVKRFQRVYKKNIVSFVKLSFITGNWNSATRVKANEVIGCDKLK